jgi:hypothetical protein
MNTAAKGRRNEHRSKAILEAEGYLCTRAAASLGAWDIIGVSATSVVLLQVKTTKWPGLPEMAILRDFPAPTQVTKLVHRWRHRQTKPDVRVL